MRLKLLDKRTFITITVHEVGIYFSSSCISHISEAQDLVSGTGQTKTKQTNTFIGSLEKKKEKYKNCRIMKMAFSPTPPIKNAYHSVYLVDQLF